MKKTQYILCLGLGLFMAANPLMAQDESVADSTGLPGDNFSLKGALALFEKASSPEGLTSNEFSSAVELIG